MKTLEIKASILDREIPFLSMAQIRMLQLQRVRQVRVRNQDFIQFRDDLSTRQILEEAWSLKARPRAMAGR